MASALPVPPLHPPLLRWFARKGRDLPWRRTRNPYRIWVSEVMLQQTQVDRVVVFYRRFLKKFPTVKRLAAARWPQVLAAWRGLGYYGRARNMMRAARAIMRKHGGRFPRTVAEFEALPGIGPYTARAIAVFAFEADELVLDTNTRRVLSRAFGLTDAAAKKYFERNAASIVPAGKSWAFHQALMDLGATVCTARDPKCAACPLKRICGFNPSSVRPLVRSSDRPLVRSSLAAAAIIHRDGKILITKRPNGHLKDLWEFPGGKRRPGEDGRACLKREIKKALGIEVAVRPHDWASHTTRFHRCSILKGNPQSRDGQQIRWVAPGELGRYRFPPADAKVLDEISRARFVDPQAITLG